MMEPVAVTKTLIERLRRLVDNQTGGDALVLVQRQLFNKVVGTLVRLSDAEARIKELEADKTAILQAIKHHSGSDHGLLGIRLLVERMEAAEALLKEAGPAIEKAMAILRELEGKLPHALGMAVGDAIDQLRFPVSAARAIHDKIGVKDE